MFPNGLQTSWWGTGVCLTLITYIIGSRQSISNYCCAEALRLRSTLRNVFVDNHGRATPVTLVQSCCPIPRGEAGGGQDRRNYRQTGSERFHHFLQLCSLTRSWQLRFDEICVFRGVSLSSRHPLLLPAPLYTFSSCISGLLVTFLVSFCPFSTRFLLRNRQMSWFEMLVSSVFVGAILFSSAGNTSTISTSFDTIILC